MFDYWIDCMFPGEVNTVKAGCDICSFEGVWRVFGLKGIEVGVDEVVFTGEHFEEEFSLGFPSVIWV